MPDTVDALRPAARAENDAATPAVIDPTDRIDYAELDSTTRRSRRRVRGPRASARAPGSG